jgi:pyruvate formate-lyase activating enzyme-like uncharacterized protein
MVTISLTEAQLDGLYMALNLAEQENAKRLQASKAGEIRFNVQTNLKNYIDELLTITTREMDKLYADSI